MAPSLCLRCLRRSMLAIEQPKPFLSATHASFSTTALLSKQPAPPKKAAVVKPGTRAQKTLRLSKNVRQTSGRPPAPGERKAIRKRIVLSNTNALEVEGLQELTADKTLQLDGANVTLDKFRGQVLGFSDASVDALRALQSFQPKQGWNLFRKPATLVRKETVALANRIAEAEGKGKRVTRQIIYGERASGKSVLLLQAQAIALLKGWIVVHLPSGLELTNAHTAYEQVDSPDGNVYVQPHYIAKLLLNMATANQEILSGMRLSREHQLPIPIQPNISLSRFAELGGRDPSLAWPVWQALWTELTAPPQEGKDGLERSPVLVSMDGVDQVMRLSSYLDADVNPVHAHDLALVKDFIKLLTGQTKLPNGGMVLGATCASNHASTPTFDYYLDSIHVQQAKPDDSVHAPQWDAYAKKDPKVGSAMKDVEVLKLKGLSKDEAKGIMEYYASSGLLRRNVTDELVSEKWTLAGSGIIGELERGNLKAAFN